jgi:hypothetical protein
VFGRLSVGTATSRARSCQHKVRVSKAVPAEWSWAPREPEASVAIDEQDRLSDDARLMAALVRIERPQTAWTIGRLANVNVGYAQEALDRMADSTPGQGDAVYAIVRRRDLGSDVYQAIEDPPRSRT